MYDTPLIRSKFSTTMLRMYLFLFNIIIIFQLLLLLCMQKLFPYHDMEMPIYDWSSICKFNKKNKQVMQFKLQKLNFCNKYLISQHMSAIKINKTSTRVYQYIQNKKSELFRDIF